MDSTALKAKSHYCRWHILFLLVLGLNVVLQFNCTEVWFDSLFVNDQTTASLQDPLLCGTAHQIKQNSDDHGPATVLQITAAATTTSSQQQQWISTPVLLSVLPQYLKPIFKINNDRSITANHFFQHSGLSPPLAS